MNLRTIRRRSAHNPTRHSAARFQTKLNRAAAKRKIDEQATCRHCRRVLIGKAYHLGGAAYIPNAKGGIGRRAPVNYYGGFVCSEGCDYQAALALEQSMPGHGWHQKTISGAPLERVRANWKDTP